MHKDGTVGVRPGCLFKTFACFPAYDLDAATDGFAKLVGPRAWAYEYLADAHGLPGYFEPRANVVAAVNEVYGAILAPSPGGAKPEVVMVDAPKAPRRAPARA